MGHGQVFRTLATNLGPPLCIAKGVCLSRFRGHDFKTTLQLTKQFAHNPFVLLSVDRDMFICLFQSKIIINYQNHTPIKFHSFMFHSLRTWLMSDASWEKYSRWHNNPSVILVNHSSVMAWCHEASYLYTVLPCFVLLWLYQEIFVDLCYTFTHIYSSGLFHWHWRNQYRADFKFAPSQWDTALQCLSLAGCKPRICPALDCPNASEVFYHNMQIRWTDSGSLPIRSRDS